ncbi:MAG: sugar phosphate permease [Chloroflexi bacterium RBG_16_57_11]|nr:MAG: sugar phosphate permease [Chloroflexi bacterium RBG_16_57_11]
MSEEHYSIYGYRWVVLAVFVLINLTIQILWITFASITLPASQYYQVSDLQIGLLAMIFMVVYIPLSLPVSWMIDTFGFYRAVSLGAILMAVFGLLRGAFGENYTAVLVCTIGIAVSQPFMMNAWTKVAARWFPIQERATAVGLAAVGNFLGTGIGLALTPLLITRFPIPTVLLIYGGVAAISTGLFIGLAREAPPTPPCPPELEERALVLDGLRSLLKSSPFWILMAVYLIANSVFNGLSTWIETIVRPRGFTPAQAGVLGGLLLLGAILGAFVLPALSDKARKRKPYLLLGVLGSIPWLLGIILGQVYGVLLVSAFAFGFLLVGIAPIGYQYAAEMTYPVPEGTSNGMLTLAGQVSVVFIFAMEAMRAPDGSFTLPFLILAGLMLVNALLLTRLKESELIARHG